ncbi:MAG: peptidylprolyl isomerase [Alphaproteobacteria bacterium]|jgi:peptidyl-prolyl cis-trans isomerase C|nr:peptidylprolyl isomerase [Alphaproteobacteria bacterium]MBT7943624.1 peptidylprolyl isomerase [Alphaproteobacteria bacterium]
MFVRFAVSVFLAAVMAAPLGSAMAAEDPVVAVVNGAEIHLSEAKAAHKSLPAQYQRVPFDVIFPGLVDSLVDSRLSAIDARKNKLHETPEFKKQMDRIGGQILQRMMLNKIMEKSVTDATVRARYDAEIKKVVAGEEILARHILLKTEDEAKAVIAELKKGGDFVELAKQKSTGPSAGDGGKLGFFGKGQMVPEFEKVAFALKAGTYTEKAVKTQFGWHVIKVEERREAKPPSFKEMEPKLRDALFQEAGAAYIEKLRKGAKIARFNADGSPKEQKKPADGAGAKK